MEKIISIERCNDCTHYCDMQFYCYLLKRNFEPKNVDNVQIPEDCPLPNTKNTIQNNEYIKNISNEIKYAMEFKSHLLTGLLHAKNIYEETYKGKL